ncbi:MAG: toll/interleukin-1 receptor domain-containing protein [Prolixibacteraceae bacterium]|nr:toll/interleukin-1 receptor domain-containing protein [Prolixibacteraceae bacterium]MBN2747520.1 toll/interleukin-1 receptor domain-containing protein [Bacteroidales bacterium]
MSIIDESQLNRFSKSAQEYYLTLDQSLRSYKSESSYNKTKVFLSHKHDEKQYLESAISLLKRYGVDVYVDWLDEGMPKTTSGVTAVKIKEKVKQNHKFILLATEGAINSKWCNWELGLGDAAKYIEDIAILPIRQGYRDFSGNEYLQIYPYITFVSEIEFINNRYYSDGAYVVFPAINGDNKVIALKDWLRRR